jgi:hypothetical protein
VEVAQEAERSIACTTEQVGVELWRLVVFILAVPVANDASRSACASHWPASSWQVEYTSGSSACRSETFRYALPSSSSERRPDKMSLVDLLLRFRPSRARHRLPPR